MVLTEDNYFSEEASKLYTGSSQIKDFMKCEAYAMAKINGDWEEETSTSMLASSYIDEAVSGTLDVFCAKHPEMFKKDGSLYSQYAYLDDVLMQAENDEMFWKYINGEHQKIMTGEIAGVSVKIKVDSFFPKKLIVDLKAMKDLQLIWNPILGRKLNFIENYDYILQAALYQEIVKQNTGDVLPFIIAVLTKEKISERALLQIPQGEMDMKLNQLKDYLPHIQELKQGKVEPISCGKCDYCKSKAKTTQIYDYNYYFIEKGGY